MFRSYEDPWKLEDELSRMKERVETDPEDVDLYLEYEELRERVNFAWQDQEYDEMMSDPADETWLYENTYGGASVTNEEPIPADELPGYKEKEIGRDFSRSTTPTYG